MVCPFLLLRSSACYLPNGGVLLRIYPTIAVQALSTEICCLIRLNKSLDRETLAVQ